jgi:hypothetical protein
LRGKYMLKMTESLVHLEIKEIDRSVYAKRDRSPDIARYQISALEQHQGNFSKYRVGTLFSIVPEASKKIGDDQSAEYQIYIAPDDLRLLIPADLFPCFQPVELENPFDKIDFIMAGILSEPRLS